MNSDFKDLLRLFCAKGVKFLVVGGYAVMNYTEPRYTKDLDILVGCDAGNARAVIEALREFGAPLKDLTESDLTTPGIFYQIGVAPNRVDIITSIAGVQFGEAFVRRSIVKIDGIDVPFISADDLIHAKLAAGRPQDLVDAGAVAKRRKK